MPLQFHSKYRLRRQAAKADGLNGIDYLEVEAGSGGSATLRVHCLKSVAALGAENVRLESGPGAAPVKVLAAGADAPDYVLEVETDSGGDFSVYALSLVKSPTDPSPPGADYDPLLCRIEFSFRVDTPFEIDPERPPAGAGTPEPQPPIDYLAKDYASFRQLMVDRLAVVMPDWRERCAADLGVALVETLAYAADQVSYYQDAVATEAYLGTARRRVSVQRHARLLDYRMHEGNNARVWVCVETKADGVVLQAGTPLLTRLPGVPSRVEKGTEAYDDAMARAPLVFETRHDVTLFRDHTEIELYTWGEPDCYLRKGATRATLKGRLPTSETDTGRSTPDEKVLRLEPGDVLIFEERGDAPSARAHGADPSHRHAVRLTSVRGAEDPLGAHFGWAPGSVTEIEWMAEDALPFDLYISPVDAEKDVKPAAMVRGNVVLADHGGRVTDCHLDPGMVPHRGPYRPALSGGPVTQCVPYDDGLACTQPASRMLVQDPRAALPDVALHDGVRPWSVRRDLLSSDRFAHDFVAETESDGRTHLRFGDNILGKRPAAGSRFRVEYRVGAGPAGNVGTEAIAHVVCGDPRVLSVANPLPAQGGRDPEPIDQVRLHAPQAFRTQARAVTESDYVEATQEHPDVQRAVARLRWTGSWHTVFITVDRKGGRPADAAFERELRQFLADRRLAGHDLEIDNPVLVPLDVALAIRVKARYLRNEVKAALLATFSSTDLPDGRRGFFHPDNFTFGQPVYLSKVVAAAMEVPGVEWVRVERFQRHGRPARDEIDKGLIELSRLEIALLDSDPGAPQNGRIEFFMTGGL